MFPPRAAGTVTIGALLCWGVLPRSAASAPQVISPDDGTYTVRVDTTRLPDRIAFGSCSHQDRPQPILELIVGHEPDLFVYLGDNIYGDSRVLDTLAAKYDRLRAVPGFQRLRANTTVLATWDDHDYGENDAGRHYPLKAESQELFLDFWGEPAGTERRATPGIYAAYLFEEGGKRLQLILLDTRTFRDDLLRNDRVPPHKNDYRPNPSPDSTLLGEAQWKWLEAQLSRAADVRIVASSIQFGHEYNGWESWTNMPHERERFLELVRRTGASGVLFISGDVHWGEISRLERDGLYPLYDVTSSGLTETWPSVEPNRNRIGEVVRENNFGLIDIHWDAVDPVIRLQLIDVDGSLRNLVTLRLSEISF
jgi:alkaline phosphatase D